MASVPLARGLSPSWVSRAVLIVGLLALAIPTLLSLAAGPWSKDTGIHGPIVLATGVWLVWRRWAEAKADAHPGRAGIISGALAFALTVYVFGRAFDFISLEVLALLGVTVAIAYGLVGAKVLQRFWFPVLYLMFLVPMPGWFIDQVTAPLKEFVSYAAEILLSSAGYAIARQGVVLFVDQYQLLVKDACAGLNSLFSLTAISLFYIYLRHNASWRYAMFLVFWIVPIAIVANLARVIALVLITHYWGEAAAQGFLHNSAGMLMFVVALLGIFALDSVFTLFLSGRRGDR